MVRVGMVRFFFMYISWGLLSIWMQAEWGKIWQPWNCNFLEQYRPARLALISFATIHIAKPGRMAWSMLKRMFRKIQALFLALSSLGREILSINDGLSEWFFPAYATGESVFFRGVKGSRIDHSTPPSLSSPQSVSGVFRLWVICRCACTPRTASIESSRIYAMGCVLMQSPF